MPIRRCTEDDITAVAQLCAKTCADDALFGDLMHPYRKEYPDDFVQFFRNRLCNHLNDATHYHLVTYEDKHGLDVVTGYATWVRRLGDNQSKSDATVQKDVFVNRAADPASADVIERAESLIKHYWSGSRAQTWLLDLLVVHPDYQRRGFGRQLVEYGLEAASRDGICASVIGSEMGDALYVSCGFRPVGRIQEGPDNPLRDLPGGRIMFYEPTVSLGRK